MSRIDPDTFGDLTVEQAKEVANGCAQSALPELLLRAIIAERFDLLVLLLDELSVDPNSPMRAGFSALHIAIEHYQVEMVRHLCARGANPNARMPGGWTPLHLAIDAEVDSANQEDRERSVGLISILLGAGADRTLMDDSGRTAGDLADEWEYDAAARLLNQREDAAKGP